jgi:hypothetical protein
MTNLTIDRRMGPAALVGAKSQRCHPEESVETVSGQVIVRREGVGQPFYNGFIGTARRVDQVKCHSACNIGSDAILVQLLFRAD